MIQKSSKSENSAHCMIKDIGVAGTVVAMQSAMVVFKFSESLQYPSFQCGKI